MLRHEHDFHRALLLVHRKLESVEHRLVELGYSSGTEHSINLIKAPSLMSDTVHVWSLPAGYASVRDSGDQVPPACARPRYSIAV